jgi:2-C-methyl-D-erythritol 2,4-cyclodiphosphate synthase
MRIGIGYDIHRLEEGRRLVLGGVEFPGPVGLAGHSDADAVLHAVADAILGAAGLGDLGEHFPDTSDEWRDADSAIMLATVVAMAAQHCLSVHNVDVNVVAQRPRLGARKEPMRQNLASLLGVSPDRVSIKARSAEGLGPVGRMQAIEVQAVVLLEDSCPAEEEDDD